MRPAVDWMAAGLLLECNALCALLDRSRWLCSADASGRRDGAVAAVPVCVVVPRPQLRRPVVRANSLDRFRHSAVAVRRCAAAIVDSTRDFCALSGLARRLKGHAPQSTAQAHSGEHDTQRRAVSAIPLLPAWPPLLQPDLRPLFPESSLSPPSLLLCQRPLWWPRGRRSSAHPSPPPFEPVVASRQVDVRASPSSVCRRCHAAITPGAVARPVRCSC